MQVMIEILVYIYIWKSEGERSMVKQTKKHKDNYMGLTAEGLDMDNGTVRFDFNEVPAQKVIKEWLFGC